MVEKVVMYKAGDGTLWHSFRAANKREQLVAAVESAMTLLGDHRALRANEYVQHDPLTVRLVRAQWKRLADIEYAGLFEDACRTSAGVQLAAHRLAAIDAQGREWQQPYFATIPPAEARCVP